MKIYKIIIITVLLQVWLTNCESVNSPKIEDKQSKNTGIEELTLKDFEIFIFPIPFRDNFRIGFVLQENSFFRLSLENVVGSEIIILKDSYLKAGSFTVVVDGKFLEDGIYMVHLNISGLGSLRKFVVKQSK